MALQKAAAAVLFGGGVDTKTDAKQVIPGKLLDLQNCVFTKNLTLAKRNGYAVLSQAVDGQVAPYANPSGLARRGGELVLFADGKALSYRPSTSSWSPIGAVSSVYASGVPVGRTGTKQTAPDVAVNGGVTALAWEDSRGGVWCSALETSSARILLPPTQLDAAGLKPRCVAVGTVLHVLWVNGSTIYVAIINPVMASTVPTPIPLVLDLFANASAQAYDVCPTFDQYAYDTSRPALIAWVAQNNVYHVGYLHPSGVLGSPVTNLPVVASWPISAAGTNRTIACAFWMANPLPSVVGGHGFSGPQAVVMWIDGANVINYRFHNGQNFTQNLQNGTVLGTPGAWSRLACEFAGTADPQDNAAPVVWFAAELPGGSADKNQVQTGSIDAVGNATVAATIRGHALASRAFADASAVGSVGGVFCCLVHPVLFFPYVAVCQINASMRAQARLLPGLSAGIPTRNVLSQVQPLVAATGGTSRRHVVALGYRIQLSGTSGTQFGEQGIQQITLDYAHDGAYRWSELGRGLYLAGALMQHYDGFRFAEGDFHCAPDTASGAITIATAGAGGGLSAGAYNYKILYEEIDGQGELHVGAPCVPVAVTALVNDKVTITIPTCRLTSKLRVRVGVFRTLVNQTGDPLAQPYYRVSSVDPTVAGNNGYVLNDPTVDSVTFVDVLSDATLQTLEPLYTNGGILANEPVPFDGAVIAGGKTRLFWGDPLEPQIVRFSQPIRDDTAAELAVALVTRVDPFGGPIVAVAVQDDNVIVFKQGAIFAFGGAGPLADGGLTGSQQFTAPQLVTSDVGCQSRSSIAQTPEGIAFQSAKGPYVLGRDLTVRRIGDDVYAYNAQRITRAVVLPDRPQVLFLADGNDVNGNPVNGARTLLWDYDRNQWSTFTNHLGLDAVIVNGTLYYLRTDGRVFQETIGQYSDAGLNIPMLVETAWMHLAKEMQGWQRFHHMMVLGTYLSAHTLRVRYRLDYEDAYSAPIDILPTNVFTPSTYGGGQYGGPGDGAYGGAVGVSSVVYQERVHINRRCQAISFRFEDLQAAGAAGASFQLSELLLTGGVLGPAFVPGASRSN